MKLRENPFYVLKLQCDADRKSIAIATEEMSFFHDAEICLDAQNQLLNQSKRLTAELCWFMDLKADELDPIRDSIENGTSISVDALTSLSKLNATLFNFSVSNEVDPFEIGYSIIDLDQQYSALDVSEITALVNRNRLAAKLALVQEQAVAEEVNKRRDDIRQIVTDRLASMKQDEYVELVTMLAEKCVADDAYGDGMVLSDFIDQYEIRMQSTLEQSTADIREQIEHIKQMTSSTVFNSEELKDALLSDSINKLVEQVKKWDILAQPLQIKSQASGMPHKNSESLGSDLRQLAVFLHNNEGSTQKALDLVNAMRDVFAEIDDISELFETDAETLNDLLQGEEAAKEIIADTNVLQKLANKMIADPTSGNVSSFIYCVKKLDAKVKQLGIDAKTKTKVRENLCYLARNTAVELHNKKHQTSFALTITEAIYIEFNDIPTLCTLLENDSLSLRRQLLFANSNRPQNSSSELPIGGLIIVIFIAVMAIIVALSPGGALNSSGKSPSKSTSVAPSRPAYSNQTSLSKLKSEIEDMEYDLKEMQSEIDHYENRLTDLANEIDYYEDQYYATENNDYYDLYYQTVDTYNNIYDDYSVEVNRYNNLYDKYSDAIDEYNAKN